MHCCGCHESGDKGGLFTFCGSRGAVINASQRPYGPAPLLERVCNRENDGKMEVTLLIRLGVNRRPWPTRTLIMDHNN